MSIKGNLETFDLSSLLQMLNYEKKTGRLKITSKDNEVLIILQQGDVVFATEARKTNRLGLLLMNNGLIDQQALDSCLTLSRRKNQSIGKTLVQEGYITARELNDFLLKQAENSIYDVFLWESGGFVYNDVDVNLKRFAGRNFHTMNLLLEASRRIDELKVLKKQIPNEQAIVKLAGDAADDREEVEFNSDEKRLLSMVDGLASVRQILDQTGYDDFTGYKLLNSLLSSGKVKLLQVLEPEELAKHALTQFQGVDSRQFRQTLDSIGLSRSSVLRLSLTRIFREALDIPLLLETVDNEAKKIAGSPEQEDLRKLKEDHRVPLMNAVLELLWQATAECR